MCVRARTQQPTSACITTRTQECACTHTHEPPPAHMYTPRGSRTCIRTHGCAHTAARICTRARAPPRPACTRALAHPPCPASRPLVRVTSPRPALPGRGRGPGPGPGSGSGPPPAAGERVPAAASRGRDRSSSRSSGKGKGRGRNRGRGQCQDRCARGDPGVPLGAGAAGGRAGRRSRLRRRGVDVRAAPRQHQHPKAAVFPSPPPGVRARRTSHAVPRGESRVRAEPHLPHPHDNSAGARHPCATTFSPRTNYHRRSHPSIRPGASGQTQTRREPPGRDGQKPLTQAAASPDARLGCGERVHPAGRRDRRACAPLCFPCTSLALSPCHGWRPRAVSRVRSSHGHAGAALLSRGAVVSRTGRARR